MIANSIKTQYGGPAQTSSLYSKPYTKKINNLRMSNGYQPPKFQLFDGKGNPKQHVAHFIETCETTGTRGDLLVKQLVWTLKENIFDWYTNLKPESIDSWKQLEGDFLNHPTYRQHDEVDKHQTAKEGASHRLYKSMESSKPGLQRQTHRNVCSWDVHPRHALGTSLHFAFKKKREKRI